MRDPDKLEIKMTYEWNKVYNGLPQSCVRDDPFDVCGKDFTKPS